MDIGLSIVLWSAFWVVDCTLRNRIRVQRPLHRRSADRADRAAPRQVRSCCDRRVSTSRSPFIDQVSKPVACAISQLDLQEPTKTKNDVFCELFASVLYHRDPDKVVDSFHQLADPEAQIRAHGQRHSR